MGKNHLLILTVYSYIPFKPRQRDFLSKISFSCEKVKPPFYYQRYTNFKKIYITSSVVALIYILVYKSKFNFVFKTFCTNKTIRIYARF